MTSTRLAHAASVTGIREGVGFWVVVALVLVALAACAFAFSGQVPDGAGQAPLVGP